MSRKVPEDEPPLDPERLRAVESLLCGGGIAETAERLGIDRRTLLRWRSEPTFAAAVNSGLRAQREHAERRLAVLCDQAINVVQRALDDGDVRTAVSVLRGCGLLAGVLTPIGPTDAEAVRVDQLARKAQRKDAELRAFLGIPPTDAD